MKVYEKAINVIAGIGFLALVPVGLAVFRVYAPLDFLARHLGWWGSATFLLILFYGLTVIRILFGHAELYGPLVFGVLASFFLMAAAVPVSFMQWYWNLLRQVSFLGNLPIIFAMALAVMGAGAGLSSLKKLPMVAEIILLVLLPIAVVVVLGILGVPDLEELLRLPPPREGWGPGVA